MVRPPPPPQTSPTPTPLPTPTHTPTAATHDLNDGVADYLVLRFVNARSQSIVRHTSFPSVPDGVPRRIGCLTYDPHNEWLLVVTTDGRYDLSF